MCYLEVECNLAKARRLNKHPWQIYFGLDSVESELIEINDNLPIYQYETLANFIRKSSDPEMLKESIKNDLN